MNYIGSKNTLLPFVSQTIRNAVGSEVAQFTDMFAGTGCVGAHMRAMGAEVVANDIQYYSYVLNKHLIETNGGNTFHGIELGAQKNHLLFKDKQNSVEHYLRTIEGVEGFVFRNYSDQSTTQRLYFSAENAKKCDAIRLQIEQWYNHKQITESEYFQLLASLLEAIDKVANTASVYGAFLKKIKPSAAKPMAFDLLPGNPTKKKGKVYHADANQLIETIQGQVLYLDPPYNQRQYGANYHLLETIAKYDNPTIRGVSGIRDWSAQKSAYCSKKEAQDQFAHLIDRAQFDYIFLSYNDEGIIPLESIEKILRTKGQYWRVTQDYARFKADRNREYKKERTIEYIHCVKCIKQPIL